MQDGPGNLANKTLKTEKKTRMKDKSPRKGRNYRGRGKKEQRKKETSTKECQAPKQSHQK